MSVSKSSSGARREKSPARLQQFFDNAVLSAVITAIAVLSASSRDLVTTDDFVLTKTAVLATGVTLQGATIFPFILVPVAVLCARLRRRHSSQ